MTAETAQWALPLAMTIMVAAAALGIVLIVVDLLAGRRHRRQCDEVYSRLTALEQAAGKDG